MKNYSRFDSDYNDKIAQAVKPQDYNPSGKGVNSMCKYNQHKLLAVSYEFSH